MEPWTIKEIIKAVGGELLSGKEDDIITSVSINSKELEEGALFVPIIGERTDAHDFIKGALEAGAAAALTSRSEQDFLEGKAYIKVKNTFLALQELGAAYRSHFTIPLIGITGSVGKTTTKEMIAAALMSKKNVLKTAGNMNSQIGLPVMMTRMEKKQEAAVIEMGMSEVGEMARLAWIAKPNLALITNIGVSHIGQLGTRENIRREKAAIINEFQKGDILLLNGDDILLEEIALFQRQLLEGEKPLELLLNEETRNKLLEIRILTYGIKEGCDYRAENIETAGEETRFTYCWPGGREEIVLKVPGIHNVSNALAALAVAEKLAVHPSVAKEGLKIYRPIAMRGQIHKKNGIRIIDDTYNASPDSMISGVNVLLSLDQAEYRIAVLADVLELGEASYSCHYEVGKYIAGAFSEGRQVDEVVAVGTLAKAITEAIQKENKRIATHNFTTNEEAIHYLNRNLKEGSALLVKGSRGMHTDEIVKALLED